MTRLTSKSESSSSMEVERFIDPGATLHEDHRRADGSGWAVMADLEGNEFCVLRSGPTNDQDEDPFWGPVGQIGLTDLRHVC